MRRVAKRGGMCLLVCAAVLVGAAACTAYRSRRLTISGSMLGREGEVLRRQLDRFHKDHPGSPSSCARPRTRPTSAISSTCSGSTPGPAEPDVLQLDVDLDRRSSPRPAGFCRSTRSAADVDDFFPATVEANRWQGSSTPLPWFVDVGMLYYRTDLVRSRRETSTSWRAWPRTAREAGVRYGLSGRARATRAWCASSSSTWAASAAASWMTSGRVVVDSDGRGRARSTFMRDAVYRDGDRPGGSLLGWQEEQTRFRFQNGEAAFMRNWPYAYALMHGPRLGASRASFGVDARCRPAPGGSSDGRAGRLAARDQRAQRSASRGGLHAHRVPAPPEQMLERARVAGQFPPRPVAVRRPGAGRRAGHPGRRPCRIIERATPRR